MITAMSPYTPLTCMLCVCKTQYADSRIKYYTTYKTDNHQTVDACVFVACITELMHKV